MADIESNIGINIDTSQALASIKNLQREISVFHSSMAKGSAQSRAESKGLQADLLNNINATGKFSASITKIASTTESFTTALEKNKFSMREYFNYAGGASKKFSKNFAKEMATVDKVARERVKDLQTQYVALGRDASGALNAMKIRPQVLDLKDLNTQTQIAAQKQQIFNQLLKQGSTNLLNFGKNTQWAGRQLMVGFTIPLSIFATKASKTFMDLEKQAIKFKRVYGDLFTPPEETKQMIADLQKLALEFTKYGVAVENTMGLAADAAAMGKTGVDLLSQVTEANRLAVLGNVEQSKALETTISVTNAFGIAAEDLAGKIDFLNAVENQTVTAIEDLTIAIPKAAPVVKQLGGSVEDLAFFLTAMKEGGINASEGANALKSGLASMINPTKQASDMLASFGINIQQIVSRNAGDAKNTVIEFAQALDKLDPLKRAQAIEQMFGKFQFARISTLFQNVIAEGTQAQRVLELSNSTASELAKLSNQELGNVAESSTYKFQAAIEKLKVSIAPIGEQFLKAVTPLIESLSKMLDGFNAMGDGVKNFVVIGGALLAGLGPVFLMTFGLIANAVANLIKGFMAVRGWFQKTKDSSSVLGEQLSYMSSEQLQAASVAASLEQTHMKLEQRFTSEAAAVARLIDVYRRAVTAQKRFVSGGQGSPTTGAVKLASGITSVPGPKGAGDVVPAMLSPGESVIPAKMTEKYAPLIQGMVAGNLPGFAKGVVSLGMPRSGKSTGKNREAADQIYQMFLQSSYKDVPPTNYGHQLAPTTGHSFPIFGLGGVYSKAGGEKVFVKPVMDEKAALAEIRATQIARQAHGLVAPEQKIVVMRDPQDVTGQRRFLALESKLDSRFVNNDPLAVFNEGQYFKQLVASLLRADKDLSASNVFGNVVADVGPAGVFSKASGLRDYADNLPSMEEQAVINLLGVKGGAKKAFAEATVGLMAGLTPDQYQQKMVSEISSVLPLLKQTVAGFGLTDPKEADVYANMISRLEQGLSVNWKRLYEIHSRVKPTAPKQSKTVVPGFADGVVSVPGPKGAGDVTPAMLSPGEAVIPAKESKKYAPLISAMIAGKVPGFVDGKDPAASRLKAQLSKEIQIFPELSDAIDAASQEIAKSAKSQSEAMDNLKNQIKPLAEIIKTTVGYNKEKGVSATSNTGANATHGNARKVLSQEEARAVGTQMAAKGYSGRTATSLANAQGDVSAYSNLVFPMPRSFNTGQISGKDSSSFVKEDPKRFMSLISKNTGLDPNDPGAIEFANNVADALEQAGSKAISESMFETIIQEQISLLAEGAAKEALKEARDTYQTFNVKGKSGKTHREAAQAGTGIGSNNQVLSDSSQRSYRSSALRKITAEANPASEAFTSSIVDSTIKSIKKGLAINSPSKEFEQIANDVTAGVRQGKDDAVRAGEEIGTTIASTAAKDGKSFAKISQSSPSNPNSFVPNRVVSDPTLSPAQAKSDVMSIMSPLKAYATTVKANLRQAWAESKAEFASIGKPEDIPAASKKAAAEQVPNILSPLRAYFTVVTANLREGWQESKAEFASIFGKSPELRVAGETAMMQFRAGLDSENPQIVIAGSKAAEKYVQAVSGSQNSVSAIITKKNADLISKINSEYQSGTSLIVSGINAESGKFKIVGGAIAEQIVSSISQRTQSLLSTVGGNKQQSQPAQKNPMFNQPLGNIVAPSKESLNEGTSKFNKGIDSLNTKMMAFSGTISSLGMMSAMAGDSLGGFGEQIYQLSNTFFVLSGILQLVNTLELSRVKNLKMDSITNAFTSLGKNIKNQANLLNTKVISGGLKNSVGNIGKIFGGLGKTVLGLGGGLGRLIPVVGAAITAFQVIQFISDVQKEQEAKIRGMGDAAFLAGEKLSIIAGLIPDYNPTRDPGTTGSAVVDTSTGQTTASQTAAKLLDPEQLAAAIAEGGALYDVGVAIKSANEESLSVILTSLANELIALDPSVDPEAVKGTLTAIAKQAGKTNISFGDMLIPNPDDPKFKANLKSSIESIAKDAEALGGKYAAATASNTDQYGSPMDPTTKKLQEDTAAIMLGGDTNAIIGRTLSAYESLNTALRTGAVSTKEFDVQTKELLGSLSLIDPQLLNPLLGEKMLGLGFDQNLIDNLDSVETKLLAIRAASTVPEGGTGIDQNLLIAVDAGKRVGATAEDIRAANIALQKIESQYQANANAAKDSSNEIVTSAETASNAWQDQIAANEQLISDSKLLVAANKEQGDGTLTQAKAIEMLKDETFALQYANAKDSKARQQLISDYQEQEISAQNLTDVLDKQAALDAADQLLKDSKSNVELQQKLEGAGLSAAAAQDILANSTWSLAFAAAGSAEELATLKGKYEEWVALAAGFTGGGDGGAPQTTPYEDAIQSLKDQRKEILNNRKAYAQLRDANMNVSDAYNMAGDSAFAAALSAEKVGTKKWEALVKLAKDFNKEKTKMDIADMTRQNQIEITKINNIGKIRDGLEKAGYSSETIESAISQIGDNPNILSKLAQDLKDGEVNAQNLVDLLNSIDGINIAININKTPAELRQDALDAVGVLNSYFSAQASLIQDAFATGTSMMLDADGKATTAAIEVNASKVNTTELQKAIDDSSAIIASKQYEIDGYNYQLEQIAAKEDEINKKYDDREAALQKISDLNKKVSDSQKSQLDVATALASGDIAAAARAMQEDNSQKASQAVEDQKAALTAAREKDIAAIALDNKETRKTLEEKILKLTQEISKEENDVLKPKQRSLDLANAQIKALTDSLTWEGKNQAAWKLIEDQINLANVELKKYLDMLKLLAEGKFNFNDPTSPSTPNATTPLKGAATDNTAKGNLISYTDLGNGLAQASTKNGSSSVVDTNAGTTISTGETGYRALRGESVADFAARIGVDPSQVRLPENSTSSSDYLNNNALVYVAPKKANMGGLIAKYAKGGLSRFAAGGYSMGTDTVPAMLTPGEFVVRKYAVQNYGVDNLKAINRGESPANSVYNYSVNVSVSTDANPDRIAREVMTQIKRIDSQRIRSR